MKKRWLLCFSILLLFAFIGSFDLGFNAITEGKSLNPADIAWMLTASGLVLLMTPGLSFFYGGMVGKKNVVSTMLQSFIALGVISILWYVVGFSLAFGESIGGIIGNPSTYAFFRGVGLDAHPALSPTIPLLLYALFQLKFAIITPALITGSFAERVKFSAYLVFICLFSLLIYCPLAHMTWHPDGLLRQWGVLDFAGGTVVHMSAGFAAIAGAWVLGPRKVLPEIHQPANIPFVLLGTGMLWFGWFGFNAGSSLGANVLAVQAFATTNTASATAMLAWIFFDAVRGRPISAIGACIGAVVGLVAITPAAGYVSIGQSVAIGFIASICSNLAVHFKNNRTNLDDTLDVFPCHGLGGIIGMLLTAFFAKEVGVIYGKTETMLYHLLTLVFVGGFTFCGSWILFKITGIIVPLRVSEADELQGLDYSQHGERFEAIDH